MKKTFYLAGLILYGFIFCEDLLAWNDKVTHKELSRHAADNSVVSKDKGDYLKNIGFNNGVEEIFKWDGNTTIKKGSIKDWLGEGAVFEDAGTNQEAIDGKARFLNHFHNPVKQSPWDTAGLDDIAVIEIPMPWPIPNIKISKSVKGQSSLLWAQDSAKQAVSVGGDQSWKAVRDYYYLALTSPSETDRQANFAKTFSGLGQQIHLIQDMAQPAHVRNDAHPEDAMKEGTFTSLLVKDERMEHWTKAHHTDKALGFMKQPPVYPTFPSNTFLSAFWDTDQYDGTATTLSLTTETSIGLAEYTNANYFSDDTINSPDARHQFPFPSTDIKDYYTCADNAPSSSKAEKRWYVSRNPCPEDPTQTIDHFLAASVLPNPQPDKISQSMLLDSRVYENYASQLLPRAVGYSAGLINYFFRGTLEISAPDSTVYSITDGSIIPQQFTKIRAKVKNTTPGESIGSGTIQAVARYKKRTDYQPDLSTDPPTAASREPEFSYSVSEPVSITSLASDTPTEYTFDFSGSLIPAGITDLYLNVIFKGALGNETDNAIAVGMKDLLEPTHLVFWNLTDRFSLGIYNDTTSTWDYHLYTSDQIKADPILLAEAGSAHIDPYPVSFEISFPKDLLSATPQIAMAQDLQAGRHIRLITLTEQISNYVRVKVTDSIDGSVKDHNLTFQSAMNQEYGGVFEPLIPVETFRTIKQHYHQGVLRCQPKLIDTSGDTYCPYPDEEAVKPADITPNQAVMSFP